MEYRKLGRTGLEASVIGFGAEWIGKMEQAEVNAMAARGAAAGVNIVDCWMSDPAVRSALGEALEPTRDQWIIQGHIGSTWQDGQYVRTRELNHVRPAFEDLLARLRTDYVHEQQERYRTQIAHLEEAEASASGAERTRATKALKKLRDQLDETSAFEDKVHHLADQMIEIDLDDGVKVNYAKFQDVLAKIK